MADLQRFAQRRSEELDEAARILAQQREDANAKTLMALHDAEERDQRSKRDLLRVQNALRKIKRRSDASKKAYTRRTGNTPEVIEVTSTWRNVLRDVFVPSWMASATTLQERYSRSCHQLSELKSVESSLLDTIAAIAAEVEAIHLGFERMLAEFTAERDEKVVLSEARYTEQTASVACQAQAEEDQLRALQTHGIPFAAAVGLSLTDDSAPELWQTALNEAETDCRNVSERADFLSRWLRDIEAEPSTLEACCWDHIQVFFSTCVGLASWRKLVQQGPNAIDLAIIDEAAHATATETLIPMFYSRRTLLIGDEMQLPPSAPMELDCKARCPVTLSISNEGRKNKQGGGIAAAVEMSPCWLERSYFEWLWRNCSQIPRVMLDTQFRMHPAIAGFVGAVFYPEGLRTAVDESSRTVAFGEFNRPVCLIPTSAYPDRQEEYLDPGYRNRLEAQIVRRVMERAEQELVDAQEFGIITPYAHQVELILREAGSLLPSFQKVRLTADDIASVDSFQGSERDVILISFVRSPAPCKRCDGKGKQRDHACPHCRGKGWRGTGLTFARDLRRLNVAFSRARKMLILVGDIDALTDSRYRGGAPGSHVLAMFRDYVQNRGKVLHVWERYHDKE